MGELTAAYRNLWEASIPQGYNFNLSAPVYNFTQPAISVNWGNVWGNTSSINSSSTKEQESVSYDDYNKKLYEIRNILKERNKQRAEIKSSIGEINTNISEIKDSRKKDGSAVMVKSRKDMNFWGKTARFLTNAGKGIVNLGKSIIGFEEDGSWNWKKALKNAVITAAAVGACFIPAVGPAIGYGLLAFGAASGTVGIIKSSIDISKAKTDEEKDKAQQNLGANIFVTATSVIGLKGAGSAFKTSGANAGAVSGSTASSASTGAAGAEAAASTAGAASATATSGTAASAAGAASGAVSDATTAASAAGCGSRLAAAGKNISNFCKDVTINAYKGAKQASVNDIASVRANGFRKTYRTKVTDSFGSLRYTQKFEKQQSDLIKSLEDRISRIDAQLASKTGNEKALLELEKESVTSIINRIRNAKTKADWEAFATDKDIVDMHSILQSERAGANDAMLATIKRISKENKTLLEKLDKLTKAKNNSMKELACQPKKHKTELDDYTADLSVESHWWNPKFGNDYQKILGHNSRNKAMIHALGTACITPAGTPVKFGYSLINPMYSDFGMVLTPDVVSAQLQELEAQKEQLEAALKELEK